MSKDNTFTVLHALLKRDAKPNPNNIEINTLPCSV